MSIRQAARRSLIGLFLVAFASLAQQLPSDYTRTSDIVYGVADGHELKLDLYLPTDAAKPPLLVYVHGGAWRGGAKDDRVRAWTFVDDGYAMASVDFRLSGDARFPAQVHDIKAAIRFLRGNAAKLGYDASRIAILGSSSGAHLAALVGVTNGNAELEGTVGEYLEQSSGVQAIVSYYGASNLTTILQQSTPFGLSEREPALRLLLGGPPDEQVELARLASPVFHVDASDPPLLILHGDQDPQMPINQAHELDYAYTEHGLEVHFEVVHGAGHGGAPFSDEKRNAIVRTFLDRHLRSSS
jgi:acetyl esterase/lipase